MVLTTETIRNTEAIIFDMGDTLRTREPDELTQRAAVKRVLEILDKEDAPESFWEELTRRFMAYTDWAQENLTESSEEEIWTRWMLPGYPREQIEPHAKELTLLWREREGLATPKPDAKKTIVELHRRGYRLALISNTISSVDVPRSLEAYGWGKYLEVVLLSSTSKRRKPDPELFWEATRAMKIEPSRCVYLGDRISRDVVGARNAGFAVAILIEPLGKPREDEKDQVEKPDVVINELSELLGIFPPR